MPFPPDFSELWGAQQEGNKHNGVHSSCYTEMLPNPCHVEHSYLYCSYLFSPCVTLGISQLAHSAVRGREGVWQRVHVHIAPMLDS